MIGSALSRLDTAEKLSIPQLQQAIQSGSIPAYMGVPLLEEKIAFEQRMRQMRSQGGGQPRRRPDGGQGGPAANPPPPMGQ